MTSTEETAMAHGVLQLARDRNESMREAASTQRDSQRAIAHSRLVRQARRAELATISHADEAQRLRAKIALMEAGS
jgi:hypothetical protein